MLDIINLKRQHKEIKDIITELRARISKQNIEEESFDISQNINHLAGILKIHLGTEDKYLYPYLLESGSDEFKRIAKSYIQEMGSISEQFTDYKNSYNTKTKILVNTKAFIADTNKVLLTIENRLKKEDSNLYNIL